MRIVVVGAGPVGLFCAIGLATRGHRVVVVDRDAGPSPDGSWFRKGVMQFHHAHTFRGRVVDALRAEVPGVLDSVLSAGARVAADADGRPVALLCRRSTLEHAMRQAAAACRNLTVHTAHVDGVAVENRRAAGAMVGGRPLAADLIVDASGRASRFTRGIRPPAEGGDCGAVYVTRQYRLREDADAGPVNSPIGLSLSFPGYLAIAFIHDDRTFSVTINHDGSDARLRGLRDAHNFESVVHAIPQLRDWIDPARSRTITPVLPGGRLNNSYRGQLDAAGHPALPGVISVGDAVCTTTPLAGRGVTLGFMQARALIAELDRAAGDVDHVAARFDRWCTDHIRPWFDDQLAGDDDRMRRWAGADVDLSRPLPSDLIVAAAAADPSLRAVADRYSSMDALPASLHVIEPRAREVYAGGWRPTVPPGPTRDELAEMCSAVAA